MIDVLHARACALYCNKYLIIYIIRVTLNTEFDTLWLSPVNFQWYFLLRSCTYSYLTIYIIRVTLNTGFNTKCLSGLHTHMKHFWVHPLVCPYSIWPQEGFYVHLFLIDAFPSEKQSKWKRVFSWCFQWKNIQLWCKKFSTIYKFLIASNLS